MDNDIEIIAVGTEESENSIDLLSDLDNKYSILDVIIFCLYLVAIVAAVTLASMAATATGPFTGLEVPLWKPFCLLCTAIMGLKYVVMGDDSRLIQRLLAVAHYER